MTPADRHLEAAQSLLDLDLPALAGALCPTGIRGVAPEDVPVALARLSTCEMVAATVIRLAWGLPDPDPYEQGMAPTLLGRLCKAWPWEVAEVSGQRGALRRPTLDAPPGPGEALWYAAAPGHDEHVDACVVDCETLVQLGDAGALPVPSITYSAIAGGQPPAPGLPGAWAVRLVARTLCWDGAAWADEATGRRVMACVSPVLLATMYGGGA